MFSYDTSFCHAANVLSRAVFGREVVPDLVLPGRYTGELIGIEYLFDQTGRALATINDDPDVPDVDVVVGEDREMDEGFVEAEDGTIAAPEATDANWLPARLGRTRSTPAVAPPVAVPRARRVRRVAESESDSSPPRAVPSPPPCVSSRPRVTSPPACLPSPLARVPSPPGHVPSPPARVPSPPARLSAYDQRRVTYSPRYRRRQLKGRFARTSSSVPGIESVKQ